MWVIIDEIAKWGLRFGILFFILFFAVAILMGIGLFFKNVSDAFRRARNLKMIAGLKETKRWPGQDRMN